MNHPAPQGLRLNVPAHVKHARLIDWVSRIASLTEASDVYWCDGSQAEYDRLCAQLVKAGTLRKLNPELRPNSYLACSDPSESPCAGANAATYTSAFTLGWPAAALVITAPP